MAEAIENTIPCDRCHTQIDLRDWSQHVRNCSDIKNNRTKKEEKRTFDDQSDNDRIRCEFCYALISGNDWKSHTRICAEEHKRRVDEPIEATIPCEYCDVQISIHEWEFHTKQCADSQRSQIKKSQEVDLVLILCEHCDKQVTPDEWEWHTKQCADSQRSQIKKSQEVDLVLILCEHCDKQVTPDEWEWHTKQCADSQRSQIKKSQEVDLVLILCEHCDKPLIANEWERHTRQCANDHRSVSRKLDNDQPILIPCEYCNIPIDAHVLERHTKKCAQEDQKRIAGIAKRISKSKEEFDAPIPCEFCGQNFSMGKINAHENICQRQQIAIPLQPDIPNDQATGANFTLPEHRNGSTTKNLTRYNVDPGSEEYKFVADNFHKTLPNQIIRIERIHNRRWYRQYEAHKDHFIERYGTSTEEWLFHGCRRSESAEAIILDCFNRSHAVNCAVGQGIYFATQAAVSYDYTQPDAQGLRHMFMARVLVGKTTRGTRSTRVCPPGYDTTGGKGVFVTYHDAQAYAQYLIVFR